VYQHLIHGVKQIAQQLKAQGISFGIMVHGDPANLILEFSNYEAHNSIVFNFRGKGNEFFRDTVF
jgi:hypothetical protein